MEQDLHRTTEMRSRRAQGSGVGRGVRPWGPAPLALAAIALGALVASRARRPYTFAAKVVLVTGGSRGLGLVLARRLASSGASIGLMARDAEELARARRTIPAHVPVLLLPADVTNAASVRQSVRRLVAEFGRLDVVINNAGQILSAPLADTTTEDFKTMLDVHFWGTLHVTRAAQPYLAGQRHSRIINICSIGGRIPVPHLSAYCASKYAQAGLSAVMAEELYQQGIRVTTVLPGLMRTGSHLHARFKGQQPAEHTVFSLVGGLPLSSMSAERAARLILNAAARGDRETIVPFTVRQIARIGAVFPNTLIRALTAINAMLPGEGADRAIPGAALPLSAAVKSVTALNERAADRNNER
jgi:NAD(P)-dependent dehydrogenase (short-subunit alcohol dehydrogenase family)